MGPIKPSLDANPSMRHCMYSCQAASDILNGMSKFLYTFNTRLRAWHTSRDCGIYYTHITNLNPQTGPKISWCLAHGKPSPRTVSCGVVPDRRPTHTQVVAYQAYVNAARALPEQARYVYLWFVFAVSTISLSGRRFGMIPAGLVFAAIVGKKPSISQTRANF